MVCISISSIYYSFGRILNKYVSSFIVQGSSNGYPTGRPNEYGGWDVNRQGNKVEVTYPVPTNKCGIIIGKGKDLL